MPKCSFCGNSIPPGTGIIFVYTSGKISNFCSRKCEKSLLVLKRKPLETRWTEEYRREHKKGVTKVSREATTV
ncbi:TPA: 50S ribosomal protein L24e [Candidatus Woesearchaeota archaeon]|nr:50S ribosomal protein L24e [Candidatus Woesearchaeota archaeon]